MRRSSARLHKGHDQSSSTAIDDNNLCVDDLTTLPLESSRSQMPETTSPCAQSDTVASKHPECTVSSMSRRTPHSGPHDSEDKRMRRRSYSAGSRFHVTEVTPNTPHHVSASSTGTFKSTHRNDPDRYDSKQLPPTTNKGSNQSNSSLSTTHNPKQSSLSQDHSTGTANIRPSGVPPPRKPPLAKPSAASANGTSRRRKVAPSSSQNVGSSSEVMSKKNSCVVS